MMRTILYATAVLIICAGSLPASAQEQGAIEGIVLDGVAEQSLPGVQVLLSELSLGAITDENGAYEIEQVPAGTYTIEARFVGFRSTTKEVTVEAGETATANFELRQSSINLDQVVVTGTGGPIEKRRLGNSISTINTASLENSPIQSFSDLIQGREPGMVGLPSSGLTGDGTRIRIRGSASLSQSNEPVVYIDGVRANSGGGFGGGFVGGGGSPSRLDDINPWMIERVEVLKGAAAATLFGTEASNGVIQIFTKQGKPGPPQFTFSSELTAIRFPDAYPDQVGFARSNSQAQRMGSILRGNENAFQRYELVSENFPNDLVGTGFAQEYSGGVSGGGETGIGSVTYFVSGRFVSEDGPFEGDPSIMPAGATTRANDAVRRAQGTANIQILPSEDLRIRVSSGYSNMDFETLQTNNNIYGTISLAQFSKPELVQDNNRTGTIAFASVAESVQQETTQQARRFNGSLGVDYTPIDDLTLDATFGIDYTNTSSREFRPFGWNVDGFASDTPKGRQQFATQNNVELTFDVKGTLASQFGSQFESDLTLGTQGFITRNSLESGQGLNFPGPGFEVTSAAANQALIESFGEVVNLGAFAQEQFGYNDYLFLTLGARYDANSAFGSDFSGVLYPKASLAFSFSDAPFWSGDVGPLSSGRLRAAIGQSGLQPGAFDALTTFGSLSSISGAGIVPNNLGNPNLEPERSTEWEVGGEFGLVEDRIGIEATYWNRTVSDALVAQQFPVTGGFTAPQVVNIGELSAQGVEVATQALVLDRRNVSVNLFANTSYLWEKVTDLGGAPPIKVGGSYPRYRNFLVEGYAPGTHFGVRLQNVPEGSLPVDLIGKGAPNTRDELLDYLAGLDPSSASLPSSLAQVLIATNANSPTGDPADFNLGKPTPDWQGAFGGDVSYGNFTLSTLFEYKFGNFFVNNLTGAFRQSNASIGRNLPDAARIERDYMTGGVDSNGNPLNDPEVRLQALDEWVNETLALDPFVGLNAIESADFLRWREVSLTYSVPSRFVERFGGRNLTLSLAGRNLALWTAYSGVDPELNAIGRGGGTSLENNFLDGVEAFGFPVPRRVSFQMRLGF